MDGLDRYGTYSFAKMQGDFVLKLGDSGSAMSLLTKELVANFDSNEFLPCRVVSLIRTKGASRPNLMIDGYSATLANGLRLSQISPELGDLSLGYQSYNRTVIYQGAEVKYTQFIWILPDTQDVEGTLRAMFVY